MVRMNTKWFWIAVVAAALSARAMAGPSAGESCRILLKVLFDDESLEAFENGYGGSLEITTDDFSQGSGALMCRIENFCDAEKYHRWEDADTKICFQYYSHGVKVLRVLGNSVADGENLYYNLTDLAQDAWTSVCVPAAALRNVVPKHGGPECPFGETTGKGKTFKNLVFHLTQVSKNVDEAYLVLDQLVVYSGKDTEAPARPSAPTVEVADKVTYLVWADVADNVAVSHYLVYRLADERAQPSKEALLGKTVIPELDVAEPGVYAVVAVDFEGNESACSTPVRVAAKDA